MKFNNNKGSFSIIALMYTIVIITIGIMFSYTVREFMSDSYIFVTKTEDQIKAESVFETLLYCMVNAEADYNSLILKDCPENIKVNRLYLDSREMRLDDDVFVSIQDTNGLISLTNSYLIGIYTSALQSLLKNVAGFDDDRARKVVDQFLDWIDRDSYKRLNGAEKFDYGFDNIPPRNYDIQYIQEFQYLKDMDRTSYEKIKRYITILPNSGFNPNTAPKEVISAFLNIEEAVAEKIIQERNIKPLTSNSQIFALAGKKLPDLGESVLFLPSGVYIIKLYKKQNGRNIHLLEAGIMLRENTYFPYIVYYMNN